MGAIDINESVDGLNFNYIGTTYRYYLKFGLQF